MPEPFERLGYSDTVFHGPERRFDGSRAPTSTSRRGSAPRHPRPHGRPLLAADREGGGGSRSCSARDVAYTRATWEKELISGFHNDPTANVASLRKLKQLAKRTAPRCSSPTTWTRGTRTGTPRTTTEEEGIHEAEGPGRDRHRSRAGDRPGDRREARFGGCDRRRRRHERIRRRGGGRQARARKRRRGRRFRAGVGRGDGRRDGRRATGGSTCSSTTPRSCRSRPGRTSTSTSGAGSWR